MFTALIINDEPHAQDTLELMLTRYYTGKFKVLQKCSSVDEAMHIIQEEEPDLIFLDIQMPRQTGFDFLDLFENRHFDVIFTTAHKDYAIEAFSHGAFGYMLKPIDVTEFQKNVVRYIKHKEEEDNLIAQSRKMDISAFSTHGGLEFVHHDNIIYCTADKNYTRVVTDQSKNPILVSKSLSYIGKRMSKDRFVRIHQSFLVNITKIKRFDRNSGLLLMINGDEVPVSTRNKRQIQKFA